MPRARGLQESHAQKRHRSPWAPGCVSPPRGVAAGQASKRDCGGQGVPPPQVPLHPFCTLARKPPKAPKLSSISQGGMRLRVWHVGLQTPVHTPSFGLGEAGGRGALTIIPGSPALSLPTALGGASEHSTPSWPRPQGSCNDLPEALRTRSLTGYRRGALESLHSTLLVPKFSRGQGIQKAPSKCH